MFERNNRPAELILVSLYYHGRNAAARHRHVTLSRTLVRSPLSLLHPSVHPVARAETRAPTCPIPSAIRVTATFIRGTTDGSARPAGTRALCTRDPRRRLNHRYEGACEIFFVGLQSTLRSQFHDAIFCHRTPDQRGSHGARVLQFFFVRGFAPIIVDGLSKFPKNLHYLLYAALSNVLLFSP